MGRIANIKLEVSGAPEYITNFKDILFFGGNITFDNIEPSPEKQGTQEIQDTKIIEWKGNCFQVEFIAVNGIPLPAMKKLAEAYPDIGFVFRWLEGAYDAGEYYRISQHDDVEWECPEDEIEQFAQEHFGIALAY